MFLPIIFVNHCLSLCAKLGPDLSMDTLGSQIASIQSVFRSVNIYSWEESSSLEHFGCFFHKYNDRPLSFDEVFYEVKASDSTRHHQLQDMCACFKGFFSIQIQTTTLTNFFIELLIFLEYYLKFNQKTYIETRVLDKKHKLLLNEFHLWFSL